MLMLKLQPHNSLYKERLLIQSSDNSRTLLGLQRRQGQTKSLCLWLKISNKVSKLVLKALKFKPIREKIGKNTQLTLTLKRLPDQVKLLQVCLHNKFLQKPSVNRK